MSLPILASCLTLLLLLVIRGVWAKKDDSGSALQDLAFLKNWKAAMAGILVFALMASWALLSGRPSTSLLMALLAGLLAGYIVEKLFPRSP